MLKKMILAGLMTATVMGGIAPANAQRVDGEGWRGRGDQAGSTERGGRSDRDGGGQRSQGGQGTQSGGDAPRAQRWQGGGDARQAPSQPRVEQQWRGDRQNDRNDARTAWRKNPRAVEQPRTERPQWREDRRGEVRQDWRDNRDDRRNDGRGDWRRDDRRDNRWGSDDRRWRGNAVTTRRFDDRTRWSGQRRWDNGWRQDRRYDWYSYRSRYGERYRLGRYYAPRGWDYGYSRFSIGIFLNSLLFSQSYWIDDPWSYRLPPAYGTLRWVRYYDDALLVDIRDGYVVDVIHDFFW